MRSFNKGFKVKFLELARFDSRACASRPHQVLKRSRARWIKFGPSQENEKTSSEDLHDQDLCQGLFS